jgi:hypothetical protein
VRVRSAAFARLFGWTGALLFVLSLVYFVFSYLRTFGAIQLDGNTRGAVTWNVTLFTAFALHHSVFARARVRQWLAPIVPPERERSAYVWIASLLFILVCAAWAPVPGTAWEATGLARWVLRIVQAAGLWLTIRSATILDIWELAGLRPLRPLRPEAWGLGPGPAEFKTRGPYGWIRHPIYAGWFLFVFSASPMTMTRLVFAIVSGVYLLIAIPLEERTIRAATAGAYDRYMATVRWRLVPGVY